MQCQAKNVSSDLRHEKETEAALCNTSEWVLQIAMWIFKTLNEYKALLWQIKVTVVCLMPHSVNSSRDTATPWVSGHAVHPKAHSHPKTQRMVVAGQTAWLSPRQFPTLQVLTTRRKQFRSLEQKKMLKLNSTQVRARLCLPFIYT